MYWDLEREDRATVEHLHLVSRGKVHRHTVAALYRTGNMAFTAMCGGAHMALARLIESGDMERAAHMAELLLVRYWPDAVREFWFLGHHVERGHQGWFTVLTRQGFLRSDYADGIKALIRESVRA